MASTELTSVPAGVFHDGATIRTALAWKKFLRDIPAVISGLFLILVIFVAIFAPLVAPFNPNAQSINDAFQSPSAHHLLGTDDLGRDILSRIIFGARLSMYISFSTVAIALIVAVPVGLISGYAGGWLDNVLMRAMDAGLSFPPLILAMGVVGALGPGATHIVLALSIVFTPGMCRLVRGQALALRQETFVDASRAIGTPTWWILARRVFPNLRSPLLVSISFTLAAALLAEAGLSYLGLGASPPQASWGSMLREAYDNALFLHPWQLVFPGAAIALTVLAFTTLADGLGEALGVSVTAGARRRGRSSGRKRMTYVAPGRHGIEASGSESPGRGEVLRVSNLCVDFESTNTKLRALDNVSLSVNRGEVMGIVGESGSGKTVTALSIMRLLASPPGVIASGSIALAGNEILDLRFAGLRRVRGSEIAMVFQDPMTSLDPAFSIGSQLIEAIKLGDGQGSQGASARAIELLELVAIPAPAERMGDYPHQLSGGMRQRVMIAMALARRPKVLIADEPTTALDVTVQAQVLDLLRELQAKLDLSVLLVTHDLGVIADICDRVVVMYAGQIVEEADVYDLFSRPRHPYTHGLLRAMPQVGRRDERLNVISGQVPELGSMPTGCRFKPRCPFAIDACGEAPIEIYSVDTSRVRCVRHSELELEGI